MFSSRILGTTKNMWSCMDYTKSWQMSECMRRDSSKKSDCRRGLPDIPPEPEPICGLPPERKETKKESVLHRIKLKIIEGGTNFGTPFRRLRCQKKVCKKKEDEPKALPAPKKKPVVAVQPQRAGVQVSILGADTAIGQYVALLLKQCPCIQKIRLYEARATSCARDVHQVVEDLKHINTNCVIQGFSYVNCELERALQNTDIVLMLESSAQDAKMPLKERFNAQAPLVKQYADVIGSECPRAFIIVCATPIDCMVPLVAETLKETGWYDPRKLFGSMAVQEMRATTLAAAALELEPRYTRVPCIGGTEGATLVPLFSRAVDSFDFSASSAQMMTEAVRSLSEAASRCDGPCLKTADLSEAHALAGLVMRVAQARLCMDIPRVTGFVEADPRYVISPARWFSNDVLLDVEGVCKKFPVPGKLNDLELYYLEKATEQLEYNVALSHAWYNKTFRGDCKYHSSKSWVYWRYRNATRPCNAAEQVAR